MPSADAQPKSGFRTSLRGPLSAKAAIAPLTSASRSGDGQSAELATSEFGLRTSDLESGVSAPLTALESEVIDLFVQISHVLGQPRSLAEIYGLLFISAAPLTMDDLIQRLNLSKGSASQGLKYLRQIGAVRTIYVPGDRRVHYEAVAELKNLATRFLREQFVPHLDSGRQRLDRIAAMVRQLPADERGRVSGRITMLQSWGKKTRRFLPLVLKIMGG